MRFTSMSFQLPISLDMKNSRVAYTHILGGTTHCLFGNKQDEKNNCPFAHSIYATFMSVFA